ncbi:flagellin N-terminal helical domain-containing protein [Devosia sp. SL43]|uniref:flagellin N-terminal helical domain-containing protein n=1 Tax=Devosia sp. SL43 TaxID=2806348 RepID=UPI001F2A1192|nr:flagellin [Devosia sp. SL43]UJW86644.1 flagellar protein [Devosia sp. SL43]
MGDISLSKAVRSNLLSLQSTATMMGKTQERLSTGNKVNSALDNPTNFFTAQSLNSRASDMNGLMDSMANGIQTLEAADNGLTSITKTLESMQSTLRQARQDKSFQTASYTMPTTGLTGASELSFTGGSVGSVAVDIALTSNTAAAATTSATATGQTTATTLATAGLADGETIIIGDGADTVTYTVGTAATEDLDDLIQAINADTDVDVTASIDADGQFTLTADNNTTAISVAGTGAIAGLAAQAVPTAVNTAKTVDALVSEINTNDDLEGKVRASNDNGKLRIENLSTQELDIAGTTSAGAINGSSASTTEILGNTVRADLADQFNELRDQLDKLSDDASFNGINLLRGDKLTITFNETGSSSIDIQTKDENSVNSTNLGVSTTLTAADLDADTNIDAELTKLKTALNEVRSQSSAFGSNLSIVQNRQDFTKSMINTLQTGAANLTLADMNEEAANLLALQTRQSLSSSSLSLASQADQSVLQLIR